MHGFDTFYRLSNRPVKDQGHNKFIGYLERISDHACYVADSVNYIVTGVSRPRR